MRIEIGLESTMCKCQHSISKLSGTFKTPVNYPFINPDCLFHDAVTVSMELWVLFKDNVCVAFCLSNATLTDGGEVGGGRRGGGGSSFLFALVRDAFCWLG